MVGHLQAAVHRTSRWDAALSSHGPGGIGTAVGYLPAGGITPELGVGAKAVVFHIGSVSDRGSRPEEAAHHAARWINYINASPIQMGNCKVCRASVRLCFRSTVRTITRPRARPPERKT